MPRNPNLTRPANGLSRCRACKKVGPEHKHNIWVWILFRWDRNHRVDRPLVVLYVLGWLLILTWLVACLRALVWS